MTSINTPLLFLSGAGLPAWIWDNVRAALPDERASAVASYPRSTAATLDDYAAEVLDAAPWHKFVVVAHSVGGAVATQMVSREPKRVAGLLGVAAAFPAPGHSFLRSLPFPQRLLLGAVVRLAGTRPPEKAIRSGVAHGLPEETKRRIVEEFATESRGLYRDPVGEGVLPDRRGYLRTANDPEMPTRLQDAYAGELDAGWTVSLPCGHLPMLEQPAATGAAIADFLDH